MKYYSLFSGGKDSISLAYYLSRSNHLAGIVFMDTFNPTIVLLKLECGMGDGSLIANGTKSVIPDVI